jgi:RNA polymerase sigma factor (sigma-70 family)
MSRGEATFVPSSTSSPNICASDSDAQLLRAHLAGGSSAFIALVTRHIDMVHAAATRQSPAHADDISQAVFLLLAQKAAKLTSHRSLGGWLYTVTRLAAGHIRRAEQRRRQHEREVAMQPARSSSDTESLLPLLDKAIGALSPADRELIVQRHLQNRPLEAIAADLAITLPAATKRTQRALERLRGVFKRKGVTAGAVGSVLVLAASHQAPPALASAIMPVAASPGIAALAHGVGEGLTALSVKTIAAALVIAALIGTVAAVALSPGGSPGAAGAVPAAASGSVEGEESHIPGQPRIAGFGCLLYAEDADELRKNATAVPSEGKAFSAYRASLTAVQDALCVAQEGQRIVHPDSLIRFAQVDTEGPRRAGLGDLLVRTRGQFSRRTGNRSLLGRTEGTGSLALERENNTYTIKADIAVLGVNILDPAAAGQNFTGSMKLSATLAAGE